MAAIFTEWCVTVNPCRVREIVSSKESFKRKKPSQPYTQGRDKNIDSDDRLFGRTLEAMLSCFALSLNADCPVNLFHYLPPPILHHPICNSTKLSTARWHPWDDLIFTIASAFLRPARGGHKYTAMPPGEMIKEEVCASNASTCMAIFLIHGEAKV